MESCVTRVGDLDRKLATQSTKNKRTASTSTGDLNNKDNTRKTIKRMKIEISLRGGVLSALCLFHARCLQRLYIAVQRKPFSTQCLKHRECFRLFFPNLKHIPIHLQILEPALGAMDGDTEEELQAPFPASLKSEVDAFRRGAANAAQRSADNGNSTPAREANRSAARRAWRCVQAARAAARLIPPLSVHALLPTAALRLPHSCVPNVRVPAGDRRGYNSNRSVAGGRGGEGEEDAPASGAAGWPLSVATVALIDVSAGSSLMCSWVDAGEEYIARGELLKAYVFPRWDMPASSFSAGSERGIVRGGNSNCDGGQVAREKLSPVKLEGGRKRFPSEAEKRIGEGRGWESGCGCWCVKCQTEGQYQPDFFRPVDPYQVDTCLRGALEAYR